MTTPTTTPCEVCTSPAIGNALEACPACGDPTRHGLAPDAIACTEGQYHAMQDGRPEPLPCTTDEEGDPLPEPYAFGDESGEIVTLDGAVYCRDSRGDTFGPFTDVADARELLWNAADESR